MTGSLLHKIFSTPKEALEALTPLFELCERATSLEEKLEILNTNPLVIEFFNQTPLLRSFLYGLSPECEVVIKSVVAIGQGERVFHNPTVSGLRNLLSQLLPVEKFYEDLGGIIGYQFLILQLMCTASLKEEGSQCNYFKPEGIDLGQKTAFLQHAIVKGIEALPHFGEIYPVGGAADRLSLFDQKTHEPLPAAALCFLGRSLLEGLVRDLQAREYLYFKLFGKQCITPIAMMTSHEKNNHHRIRAICEKNQWFGRTEENFCFFAQPSVPTVDQESNWCLESSMHLLLKPGGHGVIWKLAKERGVLQWMARLGRTKALVRQINNPIAGIDDGISAFMGLGWEGQKWFGFASCPRPLHIQEGTNVLIEKKVADAFHYVLTNVEYTEFQRLKSLDEPVEPGSPFSKFSSNTNLLFVDLKVVEEAISLSSVPGKIVNFKKATFRAETGEIKEETVARMESMMQNIADLLGETFDEPLEEGKRDGLNTYITFHQRRKTISSIKKSFKEGHSLVETPEGSFLDYQENMVELLREHCQMRLASPSQITCQLHPALGPFFSIISQKIWGGSIAPGSDLQLEIVDLLMQNLELEGSLLICAENPLGHYDQEGRLVYSLQTGKCVLKNVKIKNLGIDRKASNVFWKNEISFQERCEIKLEGSGEFYADSIIIEGHFSVTVKNGYRVLAYQEGEKLVLKEEKIEGPTWGWKYRIGECDSVSHPVLLESY